MGSPFLPTVRKIERKTYIENTLERFERIKIQKMGKSSLKNAQGLCKLGILAEELSLHFSRRFKNKLSRKKKMTGIRFKLSVLKHDINCKVTFIF